MPLTRPTYTANSANAIQGPTLVCYAPYVTAGADAAANTQVPIGLFTEDGIEIDEKKTFMDMKTDQSAFAVDTFLTEREIDLKFTWYELSPGNLNVAMGENASSLSSPPNATQGGGDFFDVLSSSGIPSVRPTFRQWIAYIPSPGHDNTTSPIAAYGYIQLFKACVVAHGVCKTGKKHLGMMQTTIRGYLDFTIAASVNRVYKWVMP
jgi:hypothetical protein